VTRDYRQDSRKVEEGPRNCWCQNLRHSRAQASVDHSNVDDENVQALRDHEIDDGRDWNGDGDV